MAPNDKTGTQPLKAESKELTESEMPLAASVKVTNEEETLEVRPEPKSGSAPADPATSTDSPTGEAKTHKKAQPATVNMPAVGRMNPLPAAPPAPVSASGKLLDKKVAYRRWLETRSKEELIDLILNLESNEPSLDITEKMMKTHRFEAVEPPPGFKPPDDLKYIRVPTQWKSDTSNPAATWHIVLLNIDQSSEPLGLIIDSEISVGRATDAATPDLDLSPFGASKKGVSRLHAKIRPSANSLALVDNDSTNGTFCNRSRLKPGDEHSLSDGDVITFGKVNFLLKIAKSPDGSNKTMV